MATDREFTKILDWPGYRVYQHEIDEKAKTLKLWIRRKRGNRRLECSGCGRKFTQIYDTSERAVRDLPWSGFTATVFVEVYRVHCPDCGVKREKVPLLPGKAPFSKRFEDAVGLACEMASARQVARQFGLAASTVRAIDLRYLERWNASRRIPTLRQMGVDEIYLGKKQKFLSVVSNLETGEPLWFGRERKKESLDGFFQTELSPRQRRGIEAACVDMWAPYRRSIEQWAPNCQIIYDKFHIMQHANAAVDEVRRAEFFRKGGRMRGVVKGKRWLLLSRRVNLDSGKKRELNTLFALNRRGLKAYLLKESLDRLWTYHYEGARFLVARDTDGNRVNFSSTYDEPKHTVNMTSARLKQAGEFTHSQPDAQHLILRGTLNGNPIVAAFHRLDESSLLLTTRGFHWINEDPFNR